MAHPREAFEWTTALEHGVPSVVVAAARERAVADGLAVASVVKVEDRVVVDDDGRSWATFVTLRVFERGEG